MLDVLLKKKNVLSYINDSDLCCIPHESNYHTDTTLPWKMTQYMISKKPILVSSSAPLKRILKDSLAGEVFRAGDYRDCGEKILKLKNSRKLLNYAQNGYDYIFKKKNNWEDKSELGLLKAYDSLFKKY